MNYGSLGFAFILLGLGLLGAAMLCDLRRYADQNSPPAEFPAPEDIDKEDEQADRLPFG